MSQPKATNGFRHPFRTASSNPILEHKAYAPVDGALSTTPVANGFLGTENPDVCPVSKMRRTSSSTGCPVSHGAGSSSPSNRYYRAASFSPPPASKSLPPQPADNDDVTSPATLPDVADDKNPCYEEYDEDLLYTNLRERVKYITQFVNFTEHDVEALNDFQPILLPLVPQLVDNVYHHLFKFDVTKKVFMPRKEGHEGRMLADLHDLALDAPQIELRKRTFAVYMRKLVTLDYDDFATWQYFDHIGIMHTGKNELKHRKLMGKTPLFVDLMHLSLLLAWTLDVLTPVILSYTEYPLSRRIEIMQAFQKVVWIQNDLFSRHYAVRSTEVAGLNQIRSTHDLSSSDDLNSIISGSFLPTSTVNSSSSGSSSGNAHSFQQQQVDNPKPERKLGLGNGSWFRFGGQS